MNRIVVGVKKTSAACDALCWAYGSAVRQNSVLEAVTAYEPISWVSPFGGCAILDGASARDAASAILHEVLVTELGQDAFDPRIQRVVVCGDTTSVLVERAQHASLLVVGRRARRWLRLPHRSVSARCAGLAACPVVIVRHQGPAIASRVEASLRDIERSDGRNPAPSPAEGRTG